ncbi:MAG: ferrous iron transport protein A [Candidatus Fimenecus sp.]|nr:ferrous iron transport protein A [Ruminococcus sp.]MDO4154085.1 ferrous iron transport protein A [Clostridia bacterium]
MIIPLTKLKIGQKSKVVSLSSTGAVRRHIIDMGITPGAVVIMRKAAPMGDPLEINVRGYELSLRKTEAQEIMVETED